MISIHEVLLHTTRLHQADLPRCAEVSFDKPASEQPHLHNRTPLPSQDMQFDYRRSDSTLQALKTL